MQAQVVQQPQLIWDKSYGGASSDVFKRMTATTDGGYAMIGFTESTNAMLQGMPNCTTGGSDIMVCKTDSNGTLQWIRKYGCNIVLNTTNILQTPDGGYIFGACGGMGMPGYHDPATVMQGFGDSGDVWIIKTDSIGNVQWQKTLGGTNYEYPTYITLQNDTTARVFSTSRSGDGDLGGVNTWQPMVYMNGRAWRFDVKLSNGNMTNSNLIKVYYNGTHYDISNAPTKILQTTSNRKIIMGGGTYWSNYSSTYDTIFKSTILSCTGSLPNAFFDGIKTDSSMYLLGSESSCRNNSTYITSGPSGYFDACLSKLDSLGNTVWNRCYGYYKTQDAARSIHQAPDGNYLVVGTGSTAEDTTMNGNLHDLKVFKITPAGNLIWQYYIGAKSSDDVGVASVMLPNGDLVIAGYSNAGTTVRTAPVYGNEDGWLLRLRTFSEKVVPGVATQETTQNAFEIKKTSETTYQITTIKPTTLTITDALGRQLHTIKAEAGNTTIDLSMYAQGVYFVTATGYKSVKLVR
jgi:hypothetical protein